jgi:hypothetical protein
MSMFSLNLKNENILLSSCFMPQKENSIIVHFYKRKSLEFEVRTNGCNCNLL